MEGVVRLKERKQIPWRRWTGQASKEMRSCWEAVFYGENWEDPDSGDNKRVLSNEKFLEIAGEIPSNKVYEDEQCFAFYDIDPQAPTHFLVIPKAHIASAAEVTAENSGVVAHIFEVIAKVARELGLDSYRIVSNIGEQAGQSVKHLHFHVLSGRDMTWPPG